jgi:hypothetical protein
MKQILALAAAAGLFITGCASQRTPVGGTFDNNVGVPEGAAAAGPGAKNPSAHPQEYKAPTPGPSPSELIPQDDHESIPLFLLPGRGQSYHI